MEKIKFNLKWIYFSVWAVLLILIFSLGFFSMFSFNGFSKSVNISLYQVMEDNAKPTSVIDAQSGKMLSEQNIENGEYASLILVSSERIHRTDESKGWTVALVSFSIAFIAVLLLIVACGVMQMFSFYFKKLAVTDLVLKCILVFLCIGLLICGAFYLQSLPQEISASYSLGASYIILPILVLLLLLSGFVFKYIEKRRGADYGK